jgi:hypothetical protein
VPPKKIKVVARQIADALGEQEFRTYKIIEGIVQHCGVDFARALLEQTLEIESGGGMLTLEGDRRRTPGGVFFHLAKGQLSVEERRVIFYNRPPSQQPNTPISVENTVAQPNEDTVTPVETSEPVEENRATLPPEIAEKLAVLERSAARLREKIATLEASGQQAGLKMTRQLLESTEQQIAEIVKQHS